MALKQIPPTALTASDSSAKEEVGAIRTESNGKEYRYVRNCGSRTYPKGAALSFVLASTNTYKVWGSRVVGNTTIAGSKNAPAGICVGSIRKGQYGWVQCKGNFLGTSLRTYTSGPHYKGVRIGLASGVNSTKVAVLCTSALIKNTFAIGVSLSTGSETFLKGVHLYGF
jgi:hypothetical protein